MVKWYHWLVSPLQHHGDLLQERVKSGEVIVYTGTVAALEQHTSCKVTAIRCLSGVVISLLLKVTRSSALAGESPMAYTP
jgi:hypothetical protein